MSHVRGVALVIVLSFIVLITCLVVAFFASVTTDAKSSYVYVKGIQTQQLAQSAISLAISQIKDATTQGPDVTWASQPGMIKTYDNTGTVQNTYRLYSAPTMKEEGNVDPIAEATAPASLGWSSLPAHMVDLNRPVADSNGNMLYPILDPRAGEAASGDSTDKLQGFRFDHDSAAYSSLDVTVSSPAPMPVRWLYQLAKGDIVTGTQIDGRTAMFPSADKSNPIVGRIGFWVDDESCKVNINTAAGDEWRPDDVTYAGASSAAPTYSGPPAGSYWDVPRFGTAYDRHALANFQPVLHEYQRYPGHPSTTYLSAVFPALTADQIGSIATRMQKGGSLGGSKLATTSVMNDSDRLYASIDELIFDPSRADQAIDKDRLNRSRFFLTAHSRAPETNLFNMPRIAIWPLSNSDLKATTSPSPFSPFDRLIAFCSTINAQSGSTPTPYPFYFTRTTDAARTGAHSPTIDYSNNLRNQAIYSYLQRLTSQEIPGFGGNFATKYGSDRDQILTEIYDYIRSTNLFDDLIEPTPYKYPTTGLQFTNRRTTAPGIDPGHGQVAPIRIGATQGFGRFLTVSEAALDFICTADGADTAHTVSNKAENLTLDKDTSGTRILLSSTQKRIEVMLLLEAFSPSQGWTSLSPDCQICVSGLEALSVNGTNLGFPAYSEGGSNAANGPNAVLQLTQNPTVIYGGRAAGGSTGFRFLLANRKLPARGVMPADSGWTATNSYPFVSKPITIDTSAGTMNFSGGTLIISIYAGSTAQRNSDTLVQEIKVKLPAGTFPIPTLVTAGTGAVTSGTYTAASATGPGYWWTFSSDGAVNDSVSGQRGRIFNVIQSPGNSSVPAAGSIIRKEDVIRSVRPFHGDYRLVAARQKVPDSVFTKHRYYDDLTQPMAHSLMEALGFPFTLGSDIGGKLVTSANYDSSRIPDIPYGVTSANASGDWDTGVAATLDGPYINKPDEGNNYRSNGSIPYFDSSQTQQAGGATFFSPNRQVPSPVMFGSLPTGVLADVPWRTLLFRPDTTANGMVGANAPKDHLLLDLFWMPVVEPYAISEPFSTAGKVNMNYQIAPFTYFQRTTALRALFRSERVAAVPPSAANSYKGSAGANYRYEIDADETLKQFQDRFDDGQPFKSATEICELYLVPKGQTYSEAGMKAYWNTNNTLTGDNVREHPYATLYPRITTKSNVYTVHFTVQTLKQVNRGVSGDWKQWTEGADVVTGEYRGSAIVERYVDLQDNLPDFALGDATDTLDSHCKLRVLMNRKFAP